jgi:lipid-A-disaccharide synthase
MSEAPTILITAAEASADAYGAGLIQALRRRLGEARFVGIGGRRMAAAGCELIAETVGRAAMITGALRHLAYYRRLIRQVKRAMDQAPPAVHVPIDAPALNWHLARAARRRGAAVAHYVAPQVWAWARWRVRKLRRLSDVVACILPFEEDYLRCRGVNARFVGHPLFDGLPPADPPDLDAAAGDGTWRIALLPGSRRGEIAAHAPALAAVRDGLSRRFPRAEFVFAAVDEAAAETIRLSTGRADLPLEVGGTAGVLARSHFAFTASGTATLLAGHFGVPMVVFYRVGRLAYALVGRWLVRTPHLSLVNILAGREMVPELMPWYGSAEQLLQAGLAMLEDPPALRHARQELLSLVAPLRAVRPATAADNAAGLVVQAMRDRGP